jgi:hypothetical protein
VLVGGYAIDDGPARLGVRAVAASRLASIPAALLHQILKIATAS